MATAVLDSTRDRLLDAAVDVFAERGYDGARVQEIARRAGLTTGAIYANFSGKAELLAQAIARQSAPELDELLRLSGGSTSDLMASMAARLLTRTRPAGSALLLEAVVASRRDPEVAALVRDIVAARAARLARFVERARRDGAVDDDVDTDALVAFGLSLAFGSLLYTAVDVERPAADAWSDLVGRVVGALAPDSPAPRSPAVPTAPGGEPA